MGLKNVEYTYNPRTPNGRGWPGDVKLMLLNIEKITRDTEWKPELTSREAVKLTAEELTKRTLTHSNPSRKT